MRFWASWFSGNYEDEGCTKPPFKFWVTGYSSRENDGLTEAQQRHLDNIQDEVEYDEYLNEHSRDDCSICAVIDAADEAAVWALVEKHFPDFRPRFCDETHEDFTPSSDRFPA